MVEGVGRKGRKKESEREVKVLLELVP